MRSMSSRSGRSFSAETAAIAALAAGSSSSRPSRQAARLNLVFLLADSLECSRDGTTGILDPFTFGCFRLTRASAGPNRTRHVLRNRTRARTDLFSYEHSFRSGMKVPASSAFRNLERLGPGEKPSQHFARQRKPTGSHGDTPRRLRSLLPCTTSAWQRCPCRSAALIPVPSWSAGSGVMRV